MDIQEIKLKISQDLYVYSNHADIERKQYNLTFSEIELALLNGEILEQYLDDPRGKSCLIFGYAGDIPIHVICGWRGDRIAIITVYIPKPPKFINPKTRGKKND